MEKPPQPGPVRAPGLHTEPLGSAGVPAGRAPAFIQLEGLTKRFGGVNALDNVSFEIARGEVHAIVGENGAGKSTLMKLLAGVHQPDAGRILIEGRPVSLKNPREARRHGVSIVFQELNLFPHRSVAANIFAGSELTLPGGWVRRRAMRDASARVLADLGLYFSSDTPAGALTLAEQQLVEIARTLSQESAIIILDEPNSALSEAESQRLFEIIRRLRERGITLLYISHRLEEVFAIADRITVLRDGRFQGTRRAGETSIPEVIAAMVGRRMDQTFPTRPAPSVPGPVVLQVRGLRQGGRLGPVDFEARAGEIVGFAGLEGAGVDELFQTLFGLLPAAAGEVLVRGQPQKLASPRAAMRAGWAMIPESRREQGLMMEWSVAGNAALLVLHQLGTRLGLINRQAVGAHAAGYIQRLGIAASGPGQKVMNLSGGNQQKVLLAKWLATQPTLLILNDPTRGVDVGAKWEIYELCHQLAAQGMTLLLTSSELEEVLGLSDRVLVFAKGRLVRECPRGGADKARLLHLMAGPAEKPELLRGA